MRSKSENLLLLLMFAVKPVGIQSVSPICITSGLNSIDQSTQGLNFLKPIFWNFLKPFFKTFFKTFFKIMDAKIQIMRKKYRIMRKVLQNKRYVL